MPHHAHQRRPDDDVNTRSTADITRDGEEPPYWVGVGKIRSRGESAELGIAFVEPGGR